MKNPLTSSLRAVACLAIVAANTLPASADAIGDLKAAAAKTLSSHSYHISMRGNAMNGDGDVILPDKMHITSKEMDMYMIGATSYMKFGGSPWKKSVDPNGSTLANMMSGFAPNFTNYQATDLGMRSVGGQAMHAYKVVNTKKGLSSTVYLDSAGRLGREDTSGVVILITRYGENVPINPPI